MKALVLTSISQDYAGCCVQSTPEPVAGPGQVLIQVIAAAVNFVDLLVAKGLYQTKPELPFVLGSDLAGVVVGVGSGVSGLKSGQPVTGMRLGGAFGEYVALPAAAVTPKPDRLSFAEAAAFGTAYYTAFVALTRRTLICPGDWLLVHGASGGVGLAAVDLGRVLGARVIAASTSGHKRDIIRAEYSPEAVLDVAAEFHADVLRLTEGRGANVIFDPVGGDIFDRSARCMAFDGDYLIVGFTSGRIPEIKMNVPLIKGFSLVGVRAGEYGRRFPEHGAADRASVWKLAAEGRLHPRVHAEFALDDWRKAFEELASRRVVGRVILRMGADSLC